MISDFIGISFVNGGRDPKTGLDCWGLVLAYYRQELGIELPDYHIDAFCSVAISERVGMAESNGWDRLESRRLLRKHDLITFNLDAELPGMATHIGIWVGQGGRFLHSRTKAGSVLGKLCDPFWTTRTSGYFRWTKTNP